MRFKLKNIDLKRHPHGFLPLVFAPLIFFLLLFILDLWPCLADIVTDGSVGPVKILSGPDMTIPESIGAVSGQNLFHSFQRFNIAENQSATFTGSDAITNVISRVTGGDISTIDGKLTSKVENADFFFINPSGVIFGNHATVDVPAAFHVSTADELHFSDGTVLNCTAPDTSTLTQAAPERFGFLGAQRASIEMNGSLLEFTPESRISISSGDISLSPADTAETKITCKSGDIHLAAVGDSAMTVDINPLQIGSLPENDPAGVSGQPLELNAENAITANGMISIHGGRIDASGNTNGNGSGNVVIQAGNLTMDNGKIVANNRGDDTNESQIILWINGSIEIQNSSYISKNSWEDGHAGAVTIMAKELTIDGQGGDAGIFCQANDDESNGEAGNVTLMVSDHLTLMDGGRIATDSYANGNAGTIVITAHDVTLDGKGTYTGISSDSGTTDAISNGGSVTLHVTGDLHIDDSAEVSATSWSQGDAGHVTLSAENITIDGKGIPTGVFTQSSDCSSPGKSGNIDIHVTDTLHLSNRGVISCDAYASGDGGAITITASKLIMDGSGGYTGISSDLIGPNPDSQAGHVTINMAESIEMTDCAEISSNAWWNGDAGQVVIHADTLTMDGHGNMTGIYCQSPDEFSEGNAGNIELIVPGTLTLIDGAQISTDIRSQGEGGQILISAGDIFIDGHGIVSQVSKSDEVDPFSDPDEMTYSTGIWSDALGISQSKAGHLKILVSGMLTLLNGGMISSSTFSQGEAGDISITAHEIMMDGNGYDTGIVSDREVDGEGDAGTIQITTSGSMTLLDNAFISSNTLSQGHGGDIHIASESLTIDGQGDDSGIQSGSTEYASGNAGSITITTKGQIQVVNGGGITTFTFSFGNAGDIFVEASEIRLDSGYIDSDAYLEKSGYVGNLSISANTIILNNSSEISILALKDLSEDELKKLPKSIIDIQAETLHLDHQSKITSQSEGNVPAGDIFIQTHQLTVRDSSKINTSARHADGGHITAQGDTVFLNNGLISTSVLESNGDGGDITIKGESEGMPTQHLVMKHGFIQANTAAENAKGGEIFFDVKGIIVDQSGEKLSIDASDRKNFNKNPRLSVIQAAAPGGTKGDIHLNNASILDISGSIADITPRINDPLPIFTDRCFMLKNSDRSTLIQNTKKNMMRWPDTSSTISFNRDRLQKLFLILH